MNFFLKQKRILKNNIFFYKSYLRAKKFITFLLDFLFIKKIKKGNNYNWIFPFLENNLENEFNIIEVGSRDGLDSITLSNKLNPNKLFVFEPNHTGISSSIYNISRYKGNVEIIFLPFAINNIREKVNLTEFREYIYGNHHGSSSLFELNTKFLPENDIDKGLEERKRVEKIYKVPCCSLDYLDFLFEKFVFLIAMDVEGSELNVLKGSEKLLKQTKYVCLETGFNQPRKGLPRDEANRIVEFMSKINFSLLAVEKNGNSLPIDNGETKQFNILFKNNLIK
tara:strand:+ start:2496 stop:3338 length:843 start_codon:yes stop_codon:yes gene_type:complete